MSSTRQDKVAEQLRQFSAEFFGVQSNRTSLITVTACSVSYDLKQATIYITVLPEDKEESALQFTKRKRSDLRTFVKKKIRIKQIPFFEIEIDKGEKSRQKIDELLNNS